METTCAPQTEAAPASACPPCEIVGRIRIQPLGPHLIRIEQEGPSGFEDRNTFAVVDRRVGERLAVETASSGGRTQIVTDYYRISVADDAATFEGIRIESPDGRLLHKLSARDLDPSFMPEPCALPRTWIMADAPRVVPPPWGALPPPAYSEHPRSGWDLENDAPDLYVFFPRASGYETFRADFLRLTGPVPLVPLFAFGFWFSHYHPYTEESALEVIDTFRHKQIPIDLFVLDTDWRVGASSGYEVNAKLFPDMRRFIRRAHEKNVRVMFNDHPEPAGDHAMDPKELRHRHRGLTSVLEMGADVWWFDRNWHTQLHAPMDGLTREVWGMRVYHDVTRAHRPKRRPLIMSHVDGIFNGRLDCPSHPAAHRYPVWWTGDTVGEWKYLRMGVQNGVDCGIQSLLPYVNEDLGGHFGNPDPECFTRFMQFGALSPVTRIHCCGNTSRYPWQHGRETERIVGDYFRLRYRLLPYLYAAGYEAHRDGTPIMRRGDLEWPQHAGAQDSTQYLLGRDLLVAPIVAPAGADGVARRTVWIPEGEWEDAWTGKTHAGPAVVTASATIGQVPVFARRGGIVAGIPQSYFVKDCHWPRIVLDAYVPSGDDESTRMLYEDDGETVAHQDGDAGLTSLRLARQGDEVRLETRPSKELTCFRVRERSWSVRFHLRAGEAAESVSLGGLPLDASEFGVIAPAANAPAMIFQGIGAPPAPGSGAVIEVSVRDTAPGAPVTVVLKLKS